MHPTKYTVCDGYETYTFDSIEDAKDAARDAMIEMDRTIKVYDDQKQVVYTAKYNPIRWM